VLTSRALGWLRAVLSGEPGEDQVAIRPAGVLVRRLVRAPATETTARPWQPSGPVLVTGGTGALGGHVARWLATRGAPHVILASRRGMVADAVQLAAAVCGAGTAVTVTACDVGDRADLAAVWTRLAAAGTTVRAVVHTAGTGQATVLAEITLAEFAEICAGKVAGARHLDELAGDGVDAFVLFSSVSATWGSSGQAAYAAANAALDALAEDRRARGLAAASLAWGPWQGGGMAAGEAEQLLRRRGLRAMPPDLAITALGEVLDRGESCISVADMDWQQFAAAFTFARPSPLLAGVAEVSQGIEAIGVPATAGRGQLAQRLAGLSAGEQEQVVLELVCEHAAEVLGHASAEAVRSGAVFRDLGFDSLTAVELRDKLAPVTGLRLPATLVFDYPTPLMLARWLRAETIQEKMTMMVPILAGLDKLENDLSIADVDQRARARITLRLQMLLSKLKGAQEEADSDAVVNRLQSSTADEVLRFIDDEFEVL
jgi:NAD(P)-dependent dehydrogenase (short-subunit alcohol dehydrogenase family)/acyl carrier protein